MKKDIFYYGERLSGDDSDNQIIYFAGPVKISISGWNEIILLSIENIKWKEMLEECLMVAKEAWELDDDQITIKEKEIEIKYNFKNLKLYIEHNIIIL